MFAEEIDFGDTPDVQTPVIYTDAKIICSVSSIPPPQVDWVKDGVPVVSSKILFNILEKVIIFFSKTLI